MGLWAPSKDVRASINRGEKKFREWRQKLCQEAAVELERYREQRRFNEQRNNKGTP